MTRLSAGAGVAFFVLLVALVLTDGGDAPANEDATAASVRAFYEQHGESVRLGTLVLGLLGLALLVFAAHLYAALRDVDRGALPVLVLAGGTAAAIICWLVAFVAAMPAMVPLDEIEDTTVTALYAFAIDGGEVLVELGVFPLACFVGGASLGVLRTGLLARPVAWLGLVSASLLLVGSAALVQPLREANEGVLAAPYFFGLLLFVVWMPAAGVSAMRRAGASEREVISAAADPQPAA